MRRAIAFTVFLLPFGCSGQTEPASSEAENAHHISAPPVRIAQREKSVEVTVEPQFPEETPFFQCAIEVRNPLDRAIHFIDVRKTCSCTGVELENDRLAPGEKTTVRLRMNWAGRSGPQSVVCLLVEEDQSTWTVTAKTTLYNRGKFQDDLAASFGIVKPGEVVTRRTFFTNYARTEDGLFDTVKFEAPQPVTLEVGHTKTEQIIDGVWKREYPLTISLNTPREVGTGQALIQAVSSGPRSGSPQVFATSANWVVRSVYRLSPPSLYVGNVDQGALPITRSVRVRRTDDQPFRIESAVIRRDGVRVATASGPDQTEWVVSLHVDHLPKTGIACDKLRLLTDQNDQREIAIPLALAPAKAVSTSR